MASRDIKQGAYVCEYASAEPTIVTEEDLVKSDEEQSKDGLRMCFGLFLVFCLLHHLCCLSNPLCSILFVKVASI